MLLRDADFIVELLNSPKWIQYIGNRHVSSLAQAREYLREKILPGYEAFGFGFYIIERQVDGRRIGNCGLTLRTGMEHADIGYSLLPRFEGQGYAFEAAQATLNYGFETHGLKHIEAIVTPDNQRSIHLLDKLGMGFKKEINLPGDEEMLLLYGRDAPQKENHK